MRYNESRHDSYPQFSRSLGTPGTMIPLQITTYGATQPWVINSLRLPEVYYRKSYIKPRGEGLIYFKPISGGAYLRRRRLCNLETTMVSVLHKELECKVEKPKYKKLEVMQTRIRIKSKLPVGKCSIPEQSRRNSTVVID